MNASVTHTGHRDGAVESGETGSDSGPSPRASAGPTPPAADCDADQSDESDQPPPASFPGMAGAIIEVQDGTSREGHLDPGPDCGHAAIDVAWIEARLTEAAALLEEPIARVAVRLVDDAAMTALHARHCGIRETTDVLTFPLSEPGEAVDVDIAVCVDEARRRAPGGEDAGGDDSDAGAAGPADPGRPERAVERELLLYCLHGLLHVTGFDDKTQAAFDAMHAREDEILRRIGVGATFRRDDGSQTSWT